MQSAALFTIAAITETGVGVARCPLCVGICSCFAGFFGKQLNLQQQACALLAALLIGAGLGIVFCHY
jgi:hypothetical protein